MIGHGAEEGLMQQIGNPSHTDAGRTAVPAGAVAGLGLFLLLGAVFPGAPKFAVAPVPIAVFVVTSAALYRRIEASRRAGEARRRQDYRAMRSREASARIAEMKRENSS